jgi:site-specific recombinase XerC
MLTRQRYAPTAKLGPSAIRPLFGWRVTGEVVPLNPAASVRGPPHMVRVGRTPVLDPAEARQQLDGIDVTKPIGLRERAPIWLMVYSFARVGAATAMTVEDGRGRVRAAAAATGAPARESRQGPRNALPS